MFTRELATALQTAAQGYPVLSVLGPRQSGKTTLARTTFPDKPYVTLENPEVRARAIEDPKGFLDQFSGGAILDEVQRTPELLSYIQGIVDEHQIPGEFILTGSYQSELRHGIAQSLAGRTAIFKLLPLTLNELGDKAQPFDLWREILTGAYPRLREKNLDISLFHSSYLATFLERDLRAQIQVRDLNQFRDFLRLLAGRTGQLVNYTDLGNSVGASAATIRHWISVLEASWIVFILPPYFENFSKRVVKTPKVYFTDTGLACALLGLESTSQLNRDPVAGGLVENWFIVEYMKRRWNQGRDAHIHFFRDKHGSEVDLLITQGPDLVAIEIKSAKTFHVSHLKGLKRFRSLVSNRKVISYLAYTGEERGSVSEVELIGFNDIETLLN